MALFAAVAGALILGNLAMLVRRLRPAAPPPKSDRWAGHPMASYAIVAAVHVVPIATAVAGSAIVSRRLAEPAGGADTVMRWGLLLLCSTAVLVAVDRVARRALPLAALLKLSMVFPDRAPRRLAVACRAGSVRDLERRLAEAKTLDAEDEPARAAEVILSLVAALHGHDRHTRGHSERVRWFADLIADELGLPEADRDRLRWAALLHDIGKLHVRKRILNKPSRLTAHEWKHIHRHPEEGARIAAPLAAWLGEWSLTIVQHHEKYDGSGYPAGLRGDEISLGARIVAVADAYEVMTAVRPYKRAVSAADARRELTRCAGDHFDPAVVRAFLQVSVGRLRWIAGPAAWVAQLPFVGWVPRLADGAAALSGQAAGFAGVAAGAAALSGVTGASPASEPAPAVPDATPVLLEIPTAAVSPDASSPPAAPAEKPRRRTTKTAVATASASPVPAPPPATTPTAAPAPSPNAAPQAAEHSAAPAKSNGGPSSTATPASAASAPSVTDQVPGRDVLREPPGKAVAEPGGIVKSKSR